MSRAQLDAVAGLLESMIDPVSRAIPQPMAMNILTALHRFAEIRRETHFSPQPLDLSGSPAIYAPLAALRPLFRNLSKASYGIFYLPYAIPNGKVLESVILQQKARR